MSYGHPVRYLGQMSTNIGGKFYSVRSHVSSGGQPFDLFRSYGGNPPYELAWEGRLFASAEVKRLLQEPEKTSWASEAAAITAKVPEASDTDLDAYGATAVSRVAPTNPLVDLSSGLAELYREGLPSRPGNAGNVGGEYLNVMFGYVPLYGDVSSTIETARHADELLRQYERDSGRWIRRRYRFPETSDTVTTVRSSMTAVPNGGSPSGALIRPGTLTTTTTTRTKIWFSGAFTYHLPQSGWRRTAAELDHLYGLVPGVDTLWELQPYSWLVDYFSNVGDVMKNITAFTQDGLVMPYGYIMRQQSVDVTYSLNCEVYQNGGFQKTTIADSISYTIKQRRLANPFGFGVLDGDLSLRQTSILAALGISRVF